MPITSSSFSYSFSTVTEPSKPGYACGPSLRSASQGGPPQYATMVDALRAASTARSSRGITYLRNGKACLETYAELLVAAQHQLGGLHKIGLHQGGAVVMQISELQAHIRAIWGCVLGGIAPVNISIPQRYELSSGVVIKLLGALDNLDAQHVLASPVNVEPLQSLLPQTKEGKHVIVHDLRQLDVRSPARHEPLIKPEDTLFYQLTSGSTGRSKCIPETHAAVISHIRHSIAHCHYAENDVTFNWLPFDHVVPMLTYHLCDVYLGRHAVQAPTADVLADPLFWVRSMETYRVSHSWAPNFGFKLVVDALAKTSATYRLASVQMLMNAGEQVTIEVCDAFLSALGLDPRVMQPAFGMAEVCTCMTYNNEYDVAKCVRVEKRSLSDDVLRIADAHEDESAVTRFVDLGPPSPGVEIRIAKDGGTQCLHELQVGHLQIRAPCVMRGYRDNPSANAECFPGDGWFDSGDLGFIYNGRLALTGRAKEMIIIRGANFFCYEIEAVAMQVDGITHARVAATSFYDENQATEALLIFFVPHSGVVPDSETAALHQFGEVSERIAMLTRAVSKRIASSLGLAPRRVVPVLDEAFHRTTSGKIQRSAFKQEYAIGKYAVAVDALARASNGTAASEFTVSWIQKHMPEAPVLDDAFTAEPGYLLLPERVTSIGASVVDAAPRAFTIRLPSGLAEQRKAIATSELSDWADFVTKPWVVVLLVDDARESSCVAPCLRSCHAMLHVLQHSCFDCESSSLTRLIPKLLVITCGAVGATRYQATLPGAAHAGVLGWAGAVQLELPVLPLQHSDVLLTSRTVSHPACAMLAEARSADTESRTTWRDDLRCVARLQRTAGRARTSADLLPKPSAGPLHLAITGGLGGLGLAAAHTILSEFAYGLALLSRSGRVAGRGYGQGLDERLSSIFKLYPRRVLVCAVDSSNQMELAALYQYLGFCGHIHMASAPLTVGQSLRHVCSRCSNACQRPCRPLCSSLTNVFAFVIVIR